MGDIFVPRSFYWFDGVVSICVDNSERYLQNRQHWQSIMENLGNIVRSFSCSVQTPKLAILLDASPLRTKYHRDNVDWASCWFTDSCDLDVRPQDAR